MNRLSSMHAAALAVHVEELLAARRIDGAEQYFTRAYDFGAARSTEEAFRRWDRTTLLADVVAVVRAFRPHVIDARYALAIEVHDVAQKENRNSILVATVGKGRMVYTSLSLTQQISNAVPGAMRLFVNLLSAGLPRPSQSVEAGASAPAITRSETAHEPLDQ